MLGAGEGDVWLVEAEPRYATSSQATIPLQEAWAERRRIAARIVGRYADAGMDTQSDCDVHGRLRLRHSPLQFGPSHAGRWLALHGAIGVDIEFDAAAAVDAKVTSGHFFHPTDVKALDDFQGRALDRAFLFSWTLKEAALKASVCGLLASLNTVVTPVAARFGRTLGLTTHATPPWPKPPEQARTFRRREVIGAIVGERVRWRVLEARWTTPAREAAQGKET